jgi:hypothetical protein
VTLNNKSFISLLAVIFCWGAAHATTLARLTMDQLSANADAVARLRCESSESRWEGGEIWTVVRFSVVESYKGDLPPQITVHVPGGRIGHISATIEATPKFLPGAQAVVFLQRISQDGFSVAGWVEGTFRITLDLGSGSESVTQDSSSFAIFDSRTRTFRSEGIRRMPMEQFHARLATAIARAGGRLR